MNQQGLRQAARPPPDPRVQTPGGDLSARQNGRPAEGGESAVSKAARFDDEKRRIIESCFSKRDPDGVQTESYITHVRVNEDALYPSTPPPPESNQANRKPRVILVAVRRSGRVRVHKARENNTGTFSIGKTWNLDELTSVQSYTHLVPRSNQEQMEKQWAANVGFIVTLGKPYYWQAPTAKEKDFFIASLVKIYRKYTGGKLPELYGFADADVEALTGQPPVQGTPAPMPMSPALMSPLPLAMPAPPPPLPAANEQRPRSPYSAPSVRAPGSDVSTSTRGEQPQKFRALSRNEPGPPTRDENRPPPIEPLRSPLKLDARQPSRENEGNQQPLYSPAPRTPAASQTTSMGSAYLLSTMPHSSPSAQSSQTSLPSTDRTNTRLQNGSVGRPQPPFVDAQRDMSSSMASASSRPSTARSEQKSIDQKSDTTKVSEDQMPERRDYLAVKQEPSRHTDVSEPNSQFATPAASPSELITEEPKIDALSSRNDQQSQFSTPPQKKDYFSVNTKKSPPSIAAGALAPGVPPIPIPEDPVVTPLPVTPTVQSEETSPSKQSGEEHRPGLGPMIKKKSTKEIAGQFRKAALAAAAFQPRQGGAGARLKALQDREKGSTEPDGITSVVPAPLFRGISTDSIKSSAPATPTAQSFDTRKSLSIMEKDEGPEPNTQIQRSATQDSVTTAEIIAKPPEIMPVTPQIASPPLEVRNLSPERARSRSPQRKKRQRQEAELSKFCSPLGIDPQILDAIGLEYNDLVVEFGWLGKLNDNRKLEEFEAEIKRDVGRAQATGWLGHIEQQEARVQDLAKAFDKAIEECEELDGLYTLYSHELDTLAADIGHIEAQSQGLQVQTANQKLLQKELQSLLQTLRIPQYELRGLRDGSLDTVDGVQVVERSLALLYRALITIDPEIRQNKIRQAEGAGPDRSRVGIYADTEIGQMRAVQEKKDNYRDEAMHFVRRFNQQMTVMFKRAEVRNSEENSRSSAHGSAPTLNSKMYQNSRQELWMYNAVMLFVREYNIYEWHTLIRSYENIVKPTYQIQFQEYSAARKGLARKPTGEEHEALFTTQEKEKAEEGLASTAARKLTVKRTKTVKASTLRQGLGEKRDGKIDAWEIFESVLQQQTRVIAEEQNFIVHFFHLSSQANVDFAEIVNSRAPDQRRMPNLNAKQSYDPDRGMAKIVQGVVEGIYGFWMTDMSKLSDSTLEADKIQSVGVICALEQCLATYEETNQEYITRSVRTLHDRTVGTFQKFIDEQIKAIEETKVKVKKRKGIISFMRTFPIFCTVVENMIPAETSPHESLEVRFIVNDAYGRILKAMWESLNFIAKDDPTVSSGGGRSAAPSIGDPEDKEALNYHILLIENMNHYLEEVDTQRNIVLEEWTDKAKHDLSIHLTQYVDAVMRRPLGKWLDFVESAEAAMKTADAAAVANKPSHSRSTAKKVIRSHDSSEIKKGVETLKRRIEKHFVEDPSLIQRVLEECAVRYSQAHDRMVYTVGRLYDKGIDIDWRKEDIAGMVRR